MLVFTLCHHYELDSAKTSPQNAQHAEVLGYVVYIVFISYCSNIVCVYVDAYLHFSLTPR